MHSGKILRTSTQRYVDFETFGEIVNLDSVKGAYDFSKPSVSLLKPELTCKLTYYSF